jgi:hypothetical protein
MMLNDHADSTVDPWRLTGTARVRRKEYEFAGDERKEFGENPRR